MSNATTIFRQIQAHASTNACDLTYIVFPVIGQLIPQGDLNFVILPKVPEGCSKGNSVAQLATGTSQGSRHCIAGKDIGNVEFFNLPDPNPLQGPILRLSADVEITHPEHRNLIFPLGTIIAVTYQRRYAEDIKRIQD
jgi:hypothetical protein